MAYFRQTWPSESITPKLHMLEHHVVPFIKKWRFGLGVYSEQGGESMHAELNNIQDTLFNHMHGTQRLRSILKEHHLRVHPLAKKMKPKIQKRKRKLP